MLNHGSHNIYVEKEVEWVTCNKFGKRDPLLLNWTSLRHDRHIEEVYSPVPRNATFLLDIKCTFSLVHSNILLPANAFIANHPFQSLISTRQCTNRRNLTLHGSTSLNARVLTTSNNTCIFINSLCSHRNCSCWSGKFSNQSLNESPSTGNGMSMACTWEISRDIFAGLRRPILPLYNTCYDTRTTLLKHSTSCFKFLDSKFPLFFNFDTDVLEMDPGALHTFFTRITYPSLPCQNVQKVKYFAQPSRRLPQRMHVESFCAFLGRLKHLFIKNVGNEICSLCEGRLLPKNIHTRRIAVSADLCWKLSSVGSENTEVSATRVECALRYGRICWSVGKVLGFKKSEMIWDKRWDMEETLWISWVVEAQLDFWREIGLGSFLNLWQFLVPP